MRIHTSVVAALFAVAYVGAFCLFEVIEFKCFQVEPAFATSTFAPPPPRTCAHVHIALYVKAFESLVRTSLTMFSLSYSWLLDLRPGKNFKSEP